MNKTAAVSLIAIAISISFILSPPPKSTYRNLFIDLSDNASVSQHLFTLTRRPHVAGSQANAEAAAYVLSTLTSYNIPTHIASYEVLLTYPVSRSLKLTRPPPQPPTTFKLTQEVYDGDPYADVAGQVLPTFHAYAKSGTVSGPAVYVNYGRVQDFGALKELGVNVSGCVAIARYGKIYRGDIIENAYAAGAVGVVIYTDRKDYGGGGDGGAKWFPEGKWMPPSGVQVGTVYGGAGDPTTPGWPSTTEACERLSEDEVWDRDGIPRIPSLPISWSDGEEIMKAIEGPLVPGEDWQGGADGQVYRVGPGPGTIELSYKGSQVISKIENVVGIIEGAEEPDRFVILGNHRDAWTFGAVDPNSGTATLLEVAERLGKLQKLGWKPRRTIVFCNWDAEEYGLIGSTEWVEENREMIASRVVAYLNVDSAVHGAGFSASATPQLDDLLKQATKQVQDPDNSSRTIYEAWVGSSNNPIIGRLGGGGSDYASFVQHAGVPSADMSFGKGYAVYHSMYDDFVWMKKFGDPMFQRHVAAANVWGIVALHLADDDILPFNYLSYAQELKNSAEELKSELLDKGVNLDPLFKSIEELSKTSSKINNQIKVMKEKRSWASMWKRDHWELRELNDRLMMAERAFADRDGLRGRSWYKHLIYGPSKHNDYGSKSFPGIDDAIEEATSLNTAESWHIVQHEVWRVSRAIKHVSLVLNGELT